MWTSPKSSRMLLWALFCCIALTLTEPCVATSSPQSRAPSGGGSGGNTPASGGGSGENTSASGEGSGGNTPASGGGSGGSTASSGGGSGGSGGNTPVSGGGSGGNTPASGGGSGENTPASGGGSGGSTASSGGGSGGNTPASGGGSVGNTPASGGGSGGNTPASGGGSGGNTPASLVGEAGENTSASGGGSGGNTPASGGGSGGSTASSGGGSGGNTPASGGGSGGNTPASGGGSGGSTASSGGGSGGSTASSSEGSGGNTPASGGGSGGNTPSSGGGSGGSTASSGGGSGGSTASSGGGSGGSTASSGGGSGGSTASSGGGIGGNTPASGGGSGGSGGSTASSGGGSGGNTPASGGGSGGNTPASGGNTTLSTSQAEQKTTTEASNNAKRKTIGDLTVELSFTIKFKGNFTKDLFNDSTEEFKNLSSTYEHVLSGVFNSTKGFRSVIITRFWLGSIGVDYTLMYAADTNSTVLKEDLTNRIPTELKNLTDVDGQYIDITFEQEVTRAVQKLTKLSEDPCSIENGCPEKCSVVDKGTAIQCIDPCIAHCVSPGVCFLDSEGEAKCRCPVNDHFVYGGDRCEQKAEKLELPSNAIIAIAAGVGGGLVFILSVALAVTCFRRRRRTRKENLHDADQKSDVSFQSAAGMNGVSIGPPLNRLYRNQTGDDIQTLRRQNSGLPMETMERTEFRSNGPRQGAMTPVHSGKMRYGEDGRIYTVLKESQIYGSQRSPAIRNHAYERFPEETALSGYNRLSYKSGRRDHVYSDIDDDTFMYQPSDVLPQTRFSGISHLNPLVSVNPSEMSGFGSHDDTPRFRDERSPVPDSDVRFLGRTSESPRREEPTKTSVMISAPTAPGLPAGESAYPPDPRDSVYPSIPREGSAYSRDYVYPSNPWEGDSVYPARPREEVVYSWVNKGGPGQGVERGNTPLIHDYSQRESGRRGHGENPGMGRAKVYDFIPEGRVSIQRAAISPRVKQF